jgi:hypothetical protein
MKKLLVVLLAVPLTFLLFSCSATKETADQANQPQIAGPAVAPGHCRIVGTIVKIEDSRSAKSDDPCSKAPCVATVRVEEILGYGSGFARTLHKADEIQIQFRSTLGPTKEILPQITPPLPGLAVGSKFQADLAAGPSPMMAGKEIPSFSADQYRIKE